MLPVQLPQPIRQMLHLQFEQAVVSFNQANLPLAHGLCASILKQDQGHAHAHHLLGVIALQEQQFALALTHLGKAIECAPQSLHFYEDRATALMHLQRWADAIHDYDLLINNGVSLSAENHYNRASAFKELGRLTPAALAYQEAYDLGLRTPEIDWILAYLYLQIQNLSLAELYIKRALVLTPDNAQMQFILSFIYLMQGRFLEAWPLYEARWAQHATFQKTPYGKPLWQTGQPIKGRTLFVYGEQGLGDIIQFVRYIPKCLDAGAKVVLGIPQSLKTVLKSITGVDFITDVDPLPEFDFHCPLLSLPRVFGTTMETIPASADCISVPADALQKWRTRLGVNTLAKRRIGLVWSGSMAPNPAQRSIELAALLPYLPPENEYYCLQKDIRLSDQSALASSGITNLSAEILDFGDTAALCSLMDTVLSVCTSVAHLAGALGCDTRILIASNPDWRWMLERSDSPWYPTARLYRQAVGESWEQTLARLGSTLLTP